MKPASCAAALLLAVGSSLPGDSCAPQDPAADARVLQQAHKLAQPVEHHRLLARLAGEWDVVVHTTPPGGAPRDDRGRVVGALILGGRYVVLDFVLQLRDVKVEAVQILGFDTLRKLWTSSWRDELATWSIEASGPPTADAPARLVMTGALTDARDPTGRPFRLQLDVVSDAQVAVRLFDSYDGREFEVQRQEWTRR
jgi:hypothetical protein